MVCRYRIDIHGRFNDRQPTTTTPTKIISQCPRENRISSTPRTPRQLPFVSSGLLRQKTRSMASLRGTVSPISNETGRTTKTEKWLYEIAKQRQIPCPPDKNLTELLATDLQSVQVKMDFKFYLTEIVKI
ncbi:hypothetical protein BIW11_03117 [Tropilaelaps mercedesae]|uniref:Uncharacterized protein n=1 Tax=Tropilaelaps mercedesae TaxID=418985 RepID=A0A1V9XRX0_9ACAR|nr:hypothetical protein BIW11_03117 [Tropilaelaps mercedesae]